MNRITTRALFLTFVLFAALVAVPAAEADNWRAPHDLSWGAYMTLTPELVLNYVGEDGVRKLFRDNPAKARAFVADNAEFAEYLPGDPKVNDVPTDNTNGQPATSTTPALAPEYDYEVTANEVNGTVVLSRQPVAPEKAEVTDPQ